MDNRKHWDQSDWNDLFLQLSKRADSAEAALRAAGNAPTQERPSFTGNSINDCERMEAYCAILDTSASLASIKLSPAPVAVVTAPDDDEDDDDEPENLTAQCRAAKSVSGSDRLPGESLTAQCLRIKAAKKGAKTT